MTLHKALPAALFAALALTGCNTTGAPKTPLQLSPAQEERLLALVAAKVEGSINAGAVPAYPFKTASISKPFPRNLPFQDKPAIGFCVFFDPELGLTTSAQVDVIEKDGGNATVFATVTPSIMAKDHCGSLEMRPFPKLIELRKKRRESRGMDTDAANSSN